MMTKIKKPHFNQFRNNEHFQCNTEFKDLVTEFGAEALKIEPLFSENYIPAYNAEDEALIKIMKNIYTDDRGDLDRRRDQTFRGMADTNNAGLNHFDADVVSASKRLKIVFDAYGNVAQLPLNEETSAIYNLLQDLRGKYANDVQKVGLTAWINKLEADNKAYDDLVKSSYEEEAAKTELKAKKTRTEVDKLFRQIIERIEALILIEGEENYVEFVRRLNVILEKYIHILAQRKGQKKSKKKKEDGEA